MQLRTYQQAAVDAAWEYLRVKLGNPCIVAPTGSGKSLILARLAADAVGWGGRVVILAHVKELLEQNAEKLQKLAPDVPFGIYSAGLGERDAHYAVTVAGIQSVYDKPDLFDPAPNIILIDECHRLRPDGEGMFQKFIAAMKERNPDMRLIGLTATPYRTSSGLICGPDRLLNEICFDIGIQDLIRNGYLCPLRSKEGREKTDLSGVHVRAGEFMHDELEAAMTENDHKVIMACMEIAEKAEHRKSVLVFCVGIDHATRVAEILGENFGETRTIFGETSSEKRADTIQAFREGKIKFLVNCEVLTTGFDAPGIDTVALLRPTLSPGLFYQMCGRGFRMAPEKTECVILDFGGNIERHGPVDEIRAPEKGKEPPAKSTKVCPQCQEVVTYACKVCPDPACGYVFPLPERIGRKVHHDGTASEADVLGEGQKTGPEEYEVTKVSYWKHRKKDAPEGHPPTLWVQYQCGLAQFNEWVCPEHQGFARGKAAGWWTKRSTEPLPTTVDLALAAIALHGIKEPGKIVVEADGKYTRVVSASDWRERPKDEQPRKDAAKISAILRHQPDEKLEEIEENLTSAQEELEF